MKHISILKYFFLFFFALPSVMHAQQLHGKVVQKNDKGAEEPVPGAAVFWLGTTVAVSTDDAGSFSINYPDSLPAKLVVASLGTGNDTLTIAARSDKNYKVTLGNTVKLGEVSVVTEQTGTNVSTITPINTELITNKELRKAACCNLSESFETNASVDVNFTDAVSGAKQIQMLGLDGIYTQVLAGNLPFIRGLASSYGLNYIPGPWIESILITKGAGSVVNGYESITGQIQVEMLEPDQADRFYINGYANLDQRLEGNVHYAHRFTDRLSTIAFGHVSDNSKRIDLNGDRFLDIPLVRQYNLFNRWHYTNGSTTEGQFGVKALMEDRQGGQINFNYDRDFGTGNAYGIGISTKQLEVFSKNGFMFPDKEYKSIGIMTNARYQKQDSYFGNRKYNGEEKSFYFNGIWQTAFKGNEKHVIKFGPSLLVDDYRESFNDSAFKRQEIVPGVFAEYTLSEKAHHIYSLVAGVRGDYHNIYGMMVNPRVHFKYNFRPLTALRLSAGRGFRVSNIYVENASIFASSRKVEVLEALRPEVAWNYGISFTHKFRILTRDASFNTDFFRTDFENQVVVDIEDADKIRFYNLQGKSFSNSFQTDLTVQPFTGFEVKAAYKHYDVRTTYSGQLLRKPLVPQDRALLTLSYATKFDKWKFDYTVKWLGESRLPDTSHNPEEYRLPGRSDAYYVMNAQVTKKFKYFDVYIGSENIADYKQKTPILASNEPFGENFDASMIWAPVNGRMIYGGFRYSIK
jgi:outer membrane receptor for ferrienterochelin and colicins